MAYLAPLRRECSKKLPVKKQALALLEGATLGAWRAQVERGGEILAVGLVLCRTPWTSMDLPRCSRGPPIHHTTTGKMSTLTPELNGGPCPELPREGKGLRVK